MFSKFKYVILREDDSVPEDQPIGEIKIPVTVEYDYTPYRKGSSEYRGGPPIEPDEGPDVEICAVTDANGEEVQLLDGDLDKIIEACFADVNGAREALIEDSVLWD
jgi:hypothetical protein